MRISDAGSIAGAVALLLLAGCGQRDDGPPSAPLAESDVTVPCRAAGAASFAKDCTVERTATPGGTVLTIHHPDGHFRRLAVTSDGHGVKAADGSEPVAVRLDGGNAIEVAIGGDHYRLPATLKPGATMPAPSR